MSFTNKIYDLTEKFGRGFPPILAAPLGRIFSYLAATVDAGRYDGVKMINLAFNNIMLDKIHGHYAEFGCFQGRITIEAFRAARRAGFWDIKFYIFDSFAGLPEGDEVFEKGEFACSRADFERNIKRNGCDLARCEIVEGLYDKSLKGYQMTDKIAVAWIDCDLYESTMPVMDFLTDKLVHGAVLCFDDWHCYASSPDEGQQRAVKEWLEKNPHISLRPYGRFSVKGESFIVNIKKADK